MNSAPATLLDPDSGQPLAQITLDGEPIEAIELLSSNGSLQAFTIQTGHDVLEDAWFKQQAVLLRTGYSQQQIKIVTYPSDGEDQGYLEFIEGTREKYHENKHIESTQQARKKSNRGTAILQTLFGA